ncbi:MAG: pyruvate, phosphate dikinase [Pirellulaceae bacterium]|nr:pyruvate, phosphate dikinase [Pirellulaceae bacterium]
MCADVTTGLPGLDKVLRDVMPGDNIVWQVDTVADYQTLVLPYARAAREASRRLIYFRFASHEKLIPDGFGAEIHALDPRLGFESFVTHVHQVIDNAGRHAIYVFDCLSELSSLWLADQMLGNFFLLTCPRLCDLETVTYFGILRNHHASFALNPIKETTQFLLDVFQHNGRMYVRPIKVQHRSPSLMNTVHVWQDEEFQPITSSVPLSEALASSQWPGLRADTRLGFWRRIFDEAQHTFDEARAGRCSPAEEKEVFERLSGMVLSRDEAMLRLVYQYLSLADILEIRDRMLGIGLIGGKALGMLLARAILKRDAPRLYKLLEAHDSFYIGCDVFYTFLIRNGLWWIRQKGPSPDTALEGLEEAREQILQGRFPDYTMDQFLAMLDYFGESPYIVRSSSLLEDAYGNAFAGKYDSVFCANQGTREQRFESLLDTVRQVYASTMSEKALRYRMSRGLLDRDEQMALLVMRVSGARYGDKFLPQIAGVGFSFNPYVWHKEIAPRAGVVRIVFGLGTRAVDRADDDHTRLVALNAPSRRPESTFDEVCEYSQRRVDYLDLAANRFESGHFLDLVTEAPGLPLDMVASRDRAVLPGQGSTNYALTFDGLLSSTPFVQNMRDMLKTLEQAYGTPVDIEFTANFLDGREYQIHVLQCRPLQVQGVERMTLPAVEVGDAERIVEARGAIIGPSRLAAVDRLIYIVPTLYGRLPLSQRYEVARLLGRINRAPGADNETIMLLGPGRWGTSSPDLGIPVHFSEISRIAILCEIVTMRENLIPDVSLGTHFLNELVEMNILYMAIFPEQQRNYLNEQFFLDAPNRLCELVPAATRWQEMIRIIDSKDVVGPDRLVLLLADTGRQEATIFIGDGDLLSKRPSPEY